MLFVESARFPRSSLVMRAGKRSLDASMTEMKRPVFVPGFLLFLTLFFVRSLYVDLFGSSIGRDDQWSTTVLGMLMPYFDGTPWLGEFFNPKNWWGHPWYTPRLVELGLTAWNGAWDCRITMLFYAFWYSAAIALFFCMWVRRSPKADWIVFACAAVLFANPATWENTIWSYQGAFFEQIATALLAIHLAGREQQTRTNAFFIFTLCLLGLLGTGSGLLLLPVASLLLIGRRHASIAHRRNAWAVAGLLVLLGAAYFAWFNPLVPRGHSHNARSLLDALHSLTRCAAWPLSNFFAEKGFARHPAWLLGLPVWIPSCIFLCREARRLLDHGMHPSKGLSSPYAEQSRIVLGLVVWQALNVAAFVYARGGGGVGPSTRHADIMLMNLVVNFLAARHLLLTAPQEHKPLRAASRFMSLYIMGVAVAAGVWCWNDLKVDGVLAQSREISLHNYLLDGNEDAMRRLPPGAAVSNDQYLDLDEVFSALRHEKFRAVLPASVQPQPRSVDATANGQPATLSGRSAIALEAGKAAQFETGPFVSPGWLQCEVFNPGTTGKIAFALDESEGSSTYEPDISGPGITQVILPRRGQGVCRVRIEILSGQNDPAKPPAQWRIRGPYHMGRGSWLVHQWHPMAKPSALAALISLVAGTFLMMRHGNRRQLRKLE